MTYVLLYPKSRVTIDGFQSIQPYYNGYFDMVSSNIPFGNIRIYDRDFDRSDDPVRKSSLAAGLAREMADEYTAKTPHKPRFVAGSVILSGCTTTILSMSSVVI